MTEAYEIKIAEIDHLSGKEKSEAKKIKYYSRLDLEELERRHSYKLAAWVVVAFFLGMLFASYIIHVSK